jgi:hypothetical protein
MYGPPTRKVAEVMLDVKRQFGDESGVQLEESDLVRWITNAQDQINYQNRVLKSTASIPSVVGQSVYTFPASQVLQIESLHYKGVRIRNMTFAQAEETLIGVDPEAVGDPQFWYEWGGTFTLWPAPDTTDTLTIYYTALVQPVPTSWDSDTLLSLPDKYYNDIVSFVLQQAYEMDEDWQASGAKAEQFKQSVDLKQEDERRSQDMTFSVITLVD